MKKIIELSLYPIKIFIYKGYNNIQFEKEIKRDTNNKVTKEFILGMSDNDFEGCVDSYKSNIVVRFKDNKPKDDVIAHEALHITKRIMDLVDISIEAEEAWAYMIGFLFNEIKKNDKKGK